MSKANDNAKGAGKYLDVETWDALKAAGFTDAELYKDHPFGPVIFAYTRKQAIEDGVLVDVTEIARTQGYRIPVAVTCGLYAEITQNPGGEPAPKGVKVGAVTCVDWLLRRLRLEIATRMRDTDRVHFRFGKTALWALCGPGDDAEPVLTVMLEGED
jgi:hypothetical protein